MEFISEAVFLSYYSFEQQHGSNGTSFSMEPNLGSIPVGLSAVSMLLGLKGQFTGSTLTMTLLLVISVPIVSQTPCTCGC